MTAEVDRVALSGAPGSPYTRKMLAVLRYRRIPYRLVYPNEAALAGLPRPKVQLLPTFYLPDETGALQAVTNSTPIIRRLERDYAGRSVIPADPALAFLDELIEDYADEWLTKAMFHYRWAYEADIDKAAAILPCWRGFSISDEDLAARGKLVRRAPDRPAALCRLQRGHRPGDRGQLSPLPRGIRGAPDRAAIPSGRAAGGVRLRRLRPADPAGRVRPDADGA